MARTYPSLITTSSLASSTKFNDETVLQLQHLLGFTLDGSTLNAITSPLEIHNFTERVAPSTPSSGILAMYADSADSWLKTKSDAGRIMYYGESVFTRKITLGSNGEFTITLADYEEAAGATAMEIAYRLRSPTAVTQQSLYARYNGETATTNYFRQAGGSDNGAASLGYANDQLIDAIPGSSSPANMYQYGRIFIHNLESGDAHVIDITGGSRYDTAKVRNNRMMQIWTNTAAITSINIRGIGGTTDLLSGSWLKLRFIKEAY